MVGSGTYFLSKRLPFVWLAASVQINCVSLLRAAQMASLSIIFLVRLIFQQEQH